MSDPSPFDVLGIAPTRESARVKRAYFAALVKHPPHQDPEGFRRLRAAYELLSKPGGLSTAFVAAPLEVAAELAQWNATWRESIDRATAEVRAAGEQRVAAKRFVERVSRLSLAEAQRAFGAGSGG